MSPKKPPQEHGHPDTAPSAQGRGELVTALVRLGYRGQDLASIIAPGRTRRQIGEALIAVQKVARKA